MNYFTATVYISTTFYIHAVYVLECAVCATGWMCMLQSYVIFTQV